METELPAALALGVMFAGILAFGVLLRVFFQTRRCLYRYPAFTVQISAPDDGAGLEAVIGAHFASDDCMESARWHEDYVVDWMAHKRMLLRRGFCCKYRRRLFREETEGRKPIRVVIWSRSGQVMLTQEFTVKELQTIVEKYR